MVKGETMNVAEKLDNLIRRHDELSALMASPDMNPKDFASLSKEYAELSPVVQKILELNSVNTEIEDMDSLLQEGDAEMKALAQEELRSLKERLPGVERELQVMLLPKDPSTPVIMVATGTGIAPMRAYIRRFFVEDVPSWNFTGLAWLFMGVANSDATLYDDEFQECVKRFPGQFRIDYALSREQNNKKGGKMYIQDKVEEYKDQVFCFLDGGAHMYFCGLKGMMPGILSMLEGVCKEKGIDYEEWLEGLKKNGQWHVEVY